MYPTSSERLSNLKTLVREIVAREGQSCDLNHIDVSHITDFSEVFLNMNFTGDISRWDMSSANSTRRMFQGCTFNGDLSKWNVSGVTNMQEMFTWSSFNGDISQWDTGRVRIMTDMFADSPFNGDISKWDVANVCNFLRMFEGSAFQGDLSAWQVSASAKLDDALPLAHMATMPTNVFHWVYAMADAGHLSSEQRQYWSDMSLVAQTFDFAEGETVVWMQEQWRKRHRPEPLYALPDLSAL